MVSSKSKARSKASISRTCFGIFSKDPEINSGYAFLAMVLLLLLMPYTAFAAYDVKQTENAWYLQDDSLPIISIKIAFENSGYAYDPEGKEGLAYFVSGMLNEGAGKYSAKQFQKLLDENAIEFRAETNADNFYISIKTISQNLPLTLDLLNAALTKPHFAEKELETVRGQILNSIIKSEESPGKIASDKLKQTIFGTHPYAQPEEGSLQSVEAITANDMHEFVKNHFAKSNIKIAIVGNADAKRVQNITKTITQNLSKTAIYKALPEFKNYPSGFEERVQMQNPQAVVMFAKKGITRESPEFYAAYVLNHIIGGSGFQSRLYKEVREDRGLSYYVGTDLNILDKAELFLGTLATTTQQVKQARDVVLQVMKEIAKKGVTEQELKDAKSYITGSFPLNLDTNSKIAGYLLMMQTNDLSADYLKNRNNHINSVTLVQINSLAKALISPKRLGFVIVGE